MEYDNRPIGIFDSGVGGLTAVRSIRKLLPGEDIIYFGDTARVPYGNKSKETITRFTSEIMSFLLKKDIKMAVVACNTASSLSLTFLKRAYRLPVVGVIVPGVKEAVKATKNHKIGVIGTNSTILSGSYERELRRVSPRAKLYTKACPLFVPLVENGMTSDPVTRMVSEKYLKTMRKRKVDTLILGCTHYPLLRKTIADTMHDIVLIDSSSAVAKEVKKIIKDNGLGCFPRKKGRIKCFVSDDPTGFDRTARFFLGEYISAKKVAL
ncbi:MAG: glutamate racemase [Candidatus Omnitrophica bacterium]|nr:glutamate racemase [Candidatus Omnitrophota bacterium]MDD5488938.1 glutamate racemase [Candidatus Omnitrophota bacterium]